MRPPDPERRSRAAKYLRDVRTFPADAASAWRREGVHGIANELANRSLYRLVKWSRSLVIAQDLASSREVPPPRGIEIRVFAGPEWYRLAPIASGRERDSFAVIAARGRTCLVAWRGDLPVGYAWCSHRMDSDIETYPLPLPPDTAYLWGLYVPPAERSAGLGSALASARLRWARAHGYRNAWRAVSMGNASSLRTVDKTSASSARVLGEVRYVKLLDKAFARYVPYTTPRTLGQGT